MAQAYYWVGADGGYKVGTMVETPFVPSTFGPKGTLEVLVKHSHTGILEWVERNGMEYYPASPIEQP